MPQVLQEVLVRVPALVVIGLVALSLASGNAQTPSAGNAPETFSATAQVKAAAGAISAGIQIQIKRYTPDFDRTSVERALKAGGYPAFLTALQKAPQVGSVAAGDQTFPIRWAREQKTDRGRTIVVITDTPVFFVGGGRKDPKPREGYRVAVLQLLVNDAGAGSGTMAAAARVKPGGETGVQIDDYAEAPVTLEGVTRKTP
jgi:hypothetical protein